MRAGDGRFLGLCIGLGVVMGLFTLGAGFFQEDFAHLLSLQHTADWRDRLSSYMMPGMFWFNYDTTHVQLFRPLPIVVLSIDQALFGSRALLFHIHSVLWYCAWLVTALLLLRTVLERTAWRFAGIMLVLSATPVVATTVISARYALLTAVFSAAAIALHVMWREYGFRILAPVAILAYILGLLTSELTIAAVGFIAAYEFVRAVTTVVATPTARGFFTALGSLLLGTAPVAIVSAIYLATYSLTGHGGGGSDIYIIPFEDPVRFLAVFPARFMLAIGTMFTGMSIEPLISAETISDAGLDRLLRVIEVAGVVFVILLAILSRRFWGTMLPTQRRAFAWLLLGACLASIASTPNLPMPRMLILATCGLLGAVGILFSLAMAEWQRGTLAKRHTAMLALIAAVFFVVQPITWVGQASLLTWHFGLQRKLALAAELENTPEHTPVFVVCTDRPLAALSIPVIRRYHGLSAAYNWDVISLMTGPHTLERDEDAAFILAPESGTFLDGFLHQVFWSERYPFAPGDVRQGRGYEVEVLETSDGRPTRIRVRFPESLDSENYRFVTFLDGELRLVEMPPSGGSLLLQSKGR